MIKENLNRILSGNRDSAERIYKFVEPLLYIYTLQIYPQVHNEITSISGKKLNYFLNYSNNTANTRPTAFEKNESLE